jgi:hypothetical protein
MPSVDYTTLSLDDVRAGLDDITRQAQATFGGLDGGQLNWRADEARWSVAQCFEHLLTADRLMLRAVANALDATQPRTVWQRAPILRGLFGRVMIRSLAPGGGRKRTAPAKSRPSSSTVAADIIQRFVDQHGEAIASVQAMDERDAARTIMVSPFVRIVTYSVLDGLRLVVAHDWRHFEQARRVLQSPGFPGSKTMERSAFR